MWRSVHVCMFLCLVGTIEFGSSETSIPAKRYTVDLDLPEQNRFQALAVMYRPEMQNLLNVFKKMVPGFVLEAVGAIGPEVDKHFRAPYAGEMIGIAAATGIDIGDVVLANLFYELTAYKNSPTKACTSIVAEALNGTIYHGRNMDYDFTDALRNLTVVIDYQQGGKTLYTGTTFVGMVGMLSAQRPYGYTITLDERDQGDWWMNLIESLVEGTGGVTSLLIRDTVAGDYTFEAAIDKLAYSPLIAPCYFIVGGTTSGQGVVITRDRVSAVDLWYLNALGGQWFLVETNYDHWTTPPPDDDRQDPAIKAMNATGRANINAPALFSVLSIPPVMNNGTTYTVTMSAAIPELFFTWVRYP
ncbi:hypothetical protein EMCRGX_G019904 [Ephydatia muelleri]